jgi:hypothetical protein
MPFKSLLARKLNGRMQEADIAHTLGMLLSTPTLWAKQTGTSSDLEARLKEGESAFANTLAPALHADGVGDTFSLGPEVKTEIPAYSVGDQFTLEGG